jgi:ATP-dependent DNA helicase Rep
MTATAMTTPTLSDEPFRETKGPILLLAGPGTGKTYQLAKRMQFLVDEQGVLPDAITVITFTREAASGMRDKIADGEKAEFIEPSKRPKAILTMHSLGHKIVEENASLIGLKPGVEVVRDAALKRGLMRDAALLCGLTESDGNTALKDKETANTPLSQQSQQIHEVYSRILTACNAIDFDDQIALACKILKKQPDVLAAYQATAHHLLVDEYQDINADQHRLIGLLTKNQTNGLFAVGDDDQSIYGFRGGDPSYIRSFANDYPGCRVLQLRVSRRCRKNILDCALAVVAAYDTDRVPKANPEYTEPEPGLVQVWNCPSEKREATLIAKAIYAKTANDTARSFFILVLNKNYVAPIRHALSALGIQHDVGTSGAAHAEWQALTILKRWLESPANLLTRHVIELMVTGGTTGIPSARVRTSEKTATRHACALEIAQLWTDVLDRGEELLAVLDAATGGDTFTAELAGLAAHLKGTYATGDAASFLNTVRSSVGVFASIEAFYKCLTSLEAESGSQNTGDAVRILTCQSSKGLEADCVFVIGVEENSMPRDAANTRQTAEEARLFFVAMTRAKKELHITHARKRPGASTYKAKSRQLKASCFVGTFPTGQVDPKYVSSESVKSRSNSKRS